MRSLIESLGSQPEAEYCCVQRRGASCLYGTADVGFCQLFTRISLAFYRKVLVTAVRWRNRKGNGKRVMGSPPGRVPDLPMVLVSPGGTASWRLHADAHVSSWGQRCQERIGIEDTTHVGQGSRREL